VAHPRDANRRVKKILTKNSTGASDERTECQILDTLSFLKFLGFETRDDVPDARTIWLFAETLIAEEAVAKLFARFDAMLQAEGFQASGGQAKRRASAPDATTTRRSRKAKLPRVGATKRRRIWTRARWMKKNSVVLYGYKNHVNIDRNNKLIRK
jgi:IS5 family transposase